MADGIESVEDLEDALNAEIGEAQGYIQVVYRQWCIANAELVSRIRLLNNCKGLTANFFF